MEAGEEKAVISFSVHRHHSASCAYGLWSRSSAIPDSTLPARSTPSTTNEVPCCAGASAQHQSPETTSRVGLCRHC
uniref:Uncharacterized protein n=1 Tax=Leersia perrieri TaxID=77586 RepID=A0A0D9WIT5_9ORYZ